MDHHSELAPLHKYVTTLLEDHVNLVKENQVTKSLDWPTEGDKHRIAEELHQGYPNAGCYQVRKIIICDVFCVLSIIVSFPQDQPNSCSLYTMSTLFPSTKSIPALTLSSGRATTTTTSVTTVALLSLSSIFRLKETSTSDILT